MNALEQFHEEHKEYTKIYEDVGACVALLNQKLADLQSQANKMDKLVGDIMFENLELRQAKWRGES